MIKSIFPVPEEYKDNLILIGVDGRFKYYSGKGVKSTDGSYELFEWLREQQKKNNNNNNNNMIRVINQVTPKALPERKKRQMYVDIAADMGCDFILIIDCDDYFNPKVNWTAMFEQVLPEIIKKENGRSDISDVKWMDDDGDGSSELRPQWRPRLWYRPEQLEYKSRHYLFGRRDNTIRFKPNANRKIPEEIMQVYHNPIDRRDAKRLEKRKYYQSDLESLEAR
jgi:hypothetical protein